MGDPSAIDPNVDLTSEVQMTIMDGTLPFKSKQDVQVASAQANDADAFYEGGAK